MYNTSGSKKHTGGLRSKPQEKYNLEDLEANGKAALMC
jgi:hypothetical protein